MFMNLDQSLVRHHIQELVHEAQRWHLQRNLRANREQSLGTRPHVDSSPTATGVIDVKQQRGALIVLKPRKERAAWSMKALALSLLGHRRSS
jgi:hypothetical protein